MGHVTAEPSGIIEDSAIIAAGDPIKVPSETETASEKPGNQRHCLQSSVLFYTSGSLRCPRIGTVDSSGAGRSLSDLKKFYLGTWPSYLTDLLSLRHVEAVGARIIVRSSPFIASNLMLGLTFMAQWGKTLSLSCMLRI